MDISAILSNVTSVTQDNQTKQVKDTEFSNILEQCSKTEDLSAETMIKNLYSDLNVSVKTGNCDVTKNNWERNDFPFWNYFNENSSVDSLNSWKASGSEPVMADANVQESLSTLGYGDMVVIIPEGLCEKMEKDSKYASEVLKKISDWKSNYDEMDNAIASSNGLNVSIYQYSKSYCITLDENGNVNNSVVVSGGLDDQATSGSNGYAKTDYKETKKSNDDKNIIKILTKNENIKLLSENQDNSSMEILATSFMKIKNRTEN